MTRQRAALVALAVAVGAAAVIIVGTLPMIMDRLNPPDIREPGEWRFSHVITTDRWPVTQRILDETHEYTIVVDPAGSTCVVATTRASLVIDADASSHPVRIGRRSGTYVDDPDAAPEIVWSYADGATAEVRCSDDTSERTLVDLAGQVRFTDSRVRLPFMVGALPRGYHVASVVELRSGAEVAVTLTPESELALPSVVVSYGGDQPSTRCIATTAYPVCLGPSWSAEELPSASSREQRAVADVADRLTVVADAGDKTTWYDAVDLPR